MAQTLPKTNISNTVPQQGLPFAPMQSTVIFLKPRFIKKLIVASPCAWFQKEMDQTCIWRDCIRQHQLFLPYAYARVMVS